MILHHVHTQSRKLFSDTNNCLFCLFLENTVGFLMWILICAWKMDEKFLNNHFFLKLACWFDTQTIKSHDWHININIIIIILLSSHLFKYFVPIYKYIFASIICKLFRGCLIIKSIVWPPLSLCNLNHCWFLVQLLVYQSYFYTYKTMMLLLENIIM